MPTGADARLATKAGLAADTGSRAAAKPAASLATKITASATAGCAR